MRITAFVIIPAILLVSLLIYARLYGVRQALQELVRTQTNNRYTLTIGSAIIKPSSLSLRFSNVKITRIEGDTTSGVSAARVPEFELRFGSVTSLFTNEMDISLLSVIHPHVTIITGGRKVDRSKITQQIIQLYPVIEAILSGFNIQSMNISKATLEFLQRDQEVFRMRYVDLQIQNWRMRELSSTSQLKINIEKQKLNLGNANLNFSGIEYNYLERHLAFTDFSVSAADSASGSNISITGKALKLTHLDYQELYRNLKYVLKRAEIVEPVINATFQWKKGRRSGEINRNIVTRMVKQYIGECDLDSAIVSRARVHLEMRQADDTVSIDLPLVDFRLHTFAVTKDSANFQIGEMQVNLNGSAISLPNNWSVELKDVLYDRHRDLTLHDITIRNTLEPKPVATLSTLKVRYFNLISMIFQRRFSAWMIFAEGGRVNLRRFASTSSRSDSTLRAPDVIVHNLSMKDINLEYRQHQTTVEVEDLSIHATNIRTDHDGKILYSLKRVSAEAASVHHPPLSLQATLSDLAFNGQKLLVNRVNATKDSIVIVAENFETEIPNAAGKISSLRYIKADKISIDGRLQAHQKQPDKDKKESFLIGQLDLGAVDARLHVGKRSFSFQGKNIRTDRMQWGHDAALPRRVTGELSAASFHAPGQEVRAGHLTLDYPRTLKLSDLNVSGPQYAFVAKTAAVRRPTLSRQLTVERLSLGGVQFKAGSRSLDADSITVVSLTSEKENPRADRVDVYKPRVVVGSSEGSQQSPPPRLIDAVPARHLYLHPGQITLKNEQHIDFGLIHLDRDKQTVRATYFTTARKKTNLTVKNVSLEPNRISFDSVLIIPNRKWYASLEVEETLISGKFAGVMVRDFSLDRFVHHRKVEDLQVDVGYADFDLRRNKLLPDPPPNKKPVTLDGLIPLPENVQVSKVNVKDGRIQYRQISDRTGEEGYLLMDKIVATSEFDSLSSFISLHARTNLYQSGVVELDYKTIADDKFKLDVIVRDVDLTRLNQIIMPLQSLRIKSGILKDYRLSVFADDDMATGDASITYEGLHLEIFKHNEPERKSLGTEVLTLLADGLILKHKKENAQSQVSHARVKYKSVFHYWVTSAIQGATTTIRKGKKSKRKG